MITWFTALEVLVSQQISTCVVAGHLAHSQSWTNPACFCTSTALPKAMMGRRVYCCGIETSFVIDLLLPMWGEVRTGESPKAGLALTDEDLGCRRKGWWLVSKGASWKQGSDHHVQMQSCPWTDQVSAGLNEVCLKKEEFLTSSKGTEPSGWKDNTLGTGDLEPLDLGPKQWVTPPLHKDKAEQKEMSLPTNTLLAERLYA